ncbi:GTP cyclohydrolase II [Sphingopyxis flava]|uniref:GTP cyclohydrolase-2 n=1 Tax=Sphingopyxis flava TaxID=1507287 RepID=A0A1T5BYI8_9SPHN|nr:GTP cyclohydrolase II [Sphingopyxis flava]SKB52227.1 GTP cyclohydrolase II [Sphingopyxis flava]
MSDAAGEGARRAARAIDALRRGWPLRVAAPDGALDLLAVESARDAALTGFASRDVLLSGERAVTLKLTNQRAAATPGPVRLAGAAASVAEALAIADPALDLAHPFKGPFRTVATGGEAAAAAAMTMARHAGLLPAFFVREAVGAAETECAAEDVAMLLDPARLEIAARARLPVETSETGEIVAFRSPEEASDHVALVIGQRDGRPPVVRLHSECLTGDVFGSLKCDCGPQLHAALHAMADAPWGVLLYLRQEGRGIGLVNKLRAYALQDQGHDTVDANLRLGFPVEARDFAIAARMLELLNIPRIRLMTNNPEKVARLEREDIAVIERIPLALPTNPHNAQYLATKRDRTGHQL